jgi:aspartyl-tRNA(Asn)/glutamyl-tRNA(Gln) amidotransferase subunit B
MRSKEEAQDYRYFPEPDLPPVMLDAAWLERIRASLPELPDARRRRFVEKLGLPDYDAGVLTGDKALADLLEATVALGRHPKEVSNWLMGEFLRLANATGIEISDAKVTPQMLSDLIGLVEEGAINRNAAKSVFEEMFNTGKPARQIVAARGLTQISDEAEIAAIVDAVIAEFPQVVGDFKGGKEKSFGFLVGQVMRRSQGRANPQLVNRLLRERMSG